MFCRFCGKPISDDSTFCSYCGCNQDAESSHENKTDEANSIKSSNGPKRIIAKFGRFIEKHKKLFIIAAVALIALTVAAVVILPKTLPDSKPVTVLKEAGTQIDTHFGLEYDITHCGFQGSNLIIRMNVTNNTKMPCTITSGDWDDIVRLINRNTKSMFSEDDNLTSNYRMYNDVNSLFAESVQATLQPGTTYEYAVIFTVSDKNANVSDYNFVVPSFGPNEDSSHYSHLYAFSLKFMQ